MNWRRAAIRLWIVLSVAWIAYCILLYRLYDFGRAQTLWAGGFNPFEIAQYYAETYYLLYERTFVPPVLLLLAGFAGAWVIRGLRRPSN